MAETKGEKIEDDKIATAIDKEEVRATRLQFAGVAFSFASACTFILLLPVLTNRLIGEEEELAGSISMILGCALTGFLMFLVLIVLDYLRTLNKLNELRAEQIKELIIHLDTKNSLSK